MAQRIDTSAIMELQGDEFTLFVYSSAAGAMYQKALRLYDVRPAIYAWQEGCEMFVGNNPAPLTWDSNGAYADPIFFENTEYIVEVDFGCNVQNVKLLKPYERNNSAPGNKLEERFHYSRRRFSGSINFGNDIGKFDLVIAFTINNISREIRIGGDVLSTKLDYHQDLKKIVAEIEEEYRMLSFDFLKKTYHGFAENPRGTTSDLLWWNVFAGVQDEFLRSAAFIICRPHNRLKPRTEYVRAEKLRRLSPQLENEIAENRHTQNHLYRNETWLLDDDTIENRFLKFAVNDIADKFHSIAQNVLPQVVGNQYYQQQIRDTEDTLTRLRHSPFFRRIGTFRGFQGESLVLKQGAGYSAVYRCWLLLQMAYDLYDGAHRMELKNIAELYEIWCFIQIKNIVRQLLGNEDVEQQSDNQALYGNFVLHLAQGGNSKILLRKNGVELAEVLYNSQLDEKSLSQTGMSDARSYTVPQRPDIILRLTKPDVSSSMKLTYLFDAKYRMDRFGGIDTPPDDAINQMHRYRDAIYYGSYEQSQGLRKEVLGGYILYPGDGDVSGADFYKSIAKVNIGAFPLRPGGDTSLLRGFIAGLLSDGKDDILQHVIPQKGTVLQVGGRVLIGIVKNEKALLERNLYYTGAKFPTTISLYGLHYFMPYVKGKGIRDIYRIRRIRTITAGEAKQLEPSDTAANDLRLAFELSDKSAFYDDYQMIRLTIADAFRESSVGELRG